MSHHDGSPVDKFRLTFGRLDMSGVVYMKNGQRTIESRMLNMSKDHEGVFAIKLYLRSELGELSFLNALKTYFY